ncbi:MAG: DUF4262 domain-containing protein [Salinibacterium sp.]|nr:MAG: DUF4262 domain-containing protein [Salinibacterium sp.]
MMWRPFGRRKRRRMTDIRSSIDEYGWAIQHVLRDDDHVPISYSVGLTNFGHPELVITGMGAEYAQGFLNPMGEDVRSGTRFRGGTWVSDLTDCDLLLIDVDDAADLTAVEQLFGHVEALQLVWCDNAGRFPWHAGFNNPPEAQPLLGPLPEGIV